MRRVVIDKAGEYVVELLHEGEEVEVVGRLRVGGSDRVGVNLTIIHSVPHTSAKTNIRSVVDGKGSVALTGKIIVKPGAQGTNSFLEERVLLLSPDAKAEAVPNLEIEANDVKCSHAATVGQIDEEQLFYLQSRGITKDEAKSLIAEAFLE